MSVLTLEIVEGPDAGLSLQLTGEVEIGRDPSAGLQLADKLVSRHHARISVDAGGAVIEDLGSSNGTLVNDEEISAPTRIAAGDRLLIGDCVVVVGDAAPVPAAAPLRPVEPAGDAADETVPVDADPRIGTELAGYRIEALVGRGGMGVVYRAKDLRLGRKVALKLLTPDLAVNEGFRDRFAWESKLAASIDHPHIIPLYDAGTADGLLFLTMRFVDGTDLKNLLDAEGPLALERAVSMIGQVAGALDAAHERGLVHRDVKPANVLVATGAGGLEASDHCYLTDFGLTKDTSQNVGLTGTGEFVGTIDYVAPEQIQGLSLGGPADQYALGCVFYECIVGARPFERSTDLDVLWAHLNEDPRPATARRPALPRAIDAVLARAMAKSPDDRYGSCAEMAAAARAALGSRWRRRSR
jgi:serine/threonine-protein kinase